jgi:hypothetical protein
MEKVEFNDAGCLIWKGTVAGGYGVLNLNGRKVHAHRVAWELANGPIPKGKQINHHCDVPLCVNPYHTYCGTQQDNMDDKSKRGRWANGFTKGPNHTKNLRKRSRSNDEEPE